MTDFFPPPEPLHCPDVCGTGGLPGADADNLGLSLPIADGILDLGTPEADLDGDGFLEAVTLGDERGLTVFTDADGDGAVDHVATVRFDGSYDSWRLANPEAGVPFGGFAPEVGRVDPPTARWERLDHGWI